MLGWGGSIGLCRAGHLHTVLQGRFLHPEAVPKV